METLVDVFRRTRLFLYSKFIEPQSLEGERQRKEFVLNVILVSLVILTSFLQFFIVYGYVSRGSNYQGVSPLIFSFVFLIFIACLLLSRKGFFVSASFLILTVYFLGTTYAATVWGVDLPIVLLAYALLIVIANMLINTRFGFYLTFFISFIIFLVGYLQLTGTIQVIQNWREETFSYFDMVEHVMLLFIVGILSWLFNRNIELSLKRARISEMQLKLERDFLEMKVEERTQELKLAQIEKVSQLYRFAEFGRLASGLFHDLVSPLTSLVLNIRKLHESSSAELAETQKYLEQSLSTTKRMEGFLLAIRRQISQQEVKVLFCLNEEINNVLHLFSYKAEKAKVDISFSSEGNPQIFGNPLKFSQVVSNLVSNAIDSYQGIQVEKAQVVVTLKFYKQFLQLTVQDWGKGIPNENIDKIFDPFFTTKDLNSGSGIGLSTTKHIVEHDFGGKINVESNPNKGSKFDIEFNL